MVATEPSTVTELPAVAVRSAGTRGRWSPVLLVVPALVVLAIFYLVPLGRLVLSSFGSAKGSLGYYQDLFGSSVLFTSLLNTLVIAFSVTVLCVLFGLPTAYLIHRSRGRVRVMLLVIILLPYFVSALVRTYAWMVLLATNGPVNSTLIAVGVFDEGQRLLFTRGAVLMGMTAVLLPMMVLPIHSAFQRMDPSLARAATSLGAGPAAAFWKVTFPQVLPGVLAGILLTFVVALGSFITPALLGGPGERVVSMDIAAQAGLLTSAGRAEAQAVVVLVVTLLVLVLASRVIRLDLIWGSVTPSALGEGSMARASRRTHLDGVAEGMSERLVWPTLRFLGKVPDGLGLLVARGLTGVVLLMMVLPILVAVLISFSSGALLTVPPPGLSLRWYEEFFRDRAWMTAIANSIFLGLLSAGVSVVLGTLAALGLTRGSYRGKGALVGVLLSPLVVPHIVIGMSLLWVFLRLGWTGTTHGLVGVHTLASISFVTVLVASSLQQFDRRLEQAAFSLGATRWQAFRHVMLPAIRPGLMASAFLAFLLSFDELTLTMFVRGMTYLTLPIKLWSDLNFQLRPILSVVSVIEMVVVIGALAAVTFATRARDKGRGGGAAADA